MKRDKILSLTFGLLSLAINVFIIIQSCLDGGDSTSQSSWVVSLLQNIINTFSKDAINESNITLFTHVVRKLIGHFGLFALDGLITSIFIYFTFKNKLNILVLMGISLVFGLLIAISTEVIQHFIPGRSGEALDVLIDYSGYFLFAIYTLLITYLIISRKHSKGR